MQIKRGLLVVLVLACGLALAACDKAPENAAQLYEDNDEVLVLRILKEDQDIEWALKRL